MAPPRQGAKRASAAADTGARDTAAFFNKLAPNIIDPNIQIRFKSLINRDNKKDACTLRDPRLGLTLLQIAVLADNVSAGAPLSGTPRPTNFSINLTTAV